MPKLTIEEEVGIKPKIKVKGVPNPQKIYSEIKDILVMRIGIDPSDVDESKYEHDKVGEGEKIKTEIEATKKKDKYTQNVYSISIEMTLKPVHKGDVKYVGDVEINIKGKVKTSYPQDTALQKSIVWDAFRAFYEKAIYGDIKKAYIQDATEKVIKIRDELTHFLNLLPRMAKE